MGIYNLKHFEIFPTPNLQVNSHDEMYYWKYEYIHILHIIYAMLSLRFLKIGKHHGLENFHQKVY